MRKGDFASVRWHRLRRSVMPPEQAMLLEPGHLLIPGAGAVVGAIVTGSMVVTIYDEIRRRGGLCHFLLPVPPEGGPNSPLYGSVALPALFRLFGLKDCPPGQLSIGIYGASSPKGAGLGQRALANANLAIARRVISEYQLELEDEDVGGHRGRKLWFLSTTNEMLVMRTDALRASDWWRGVQEGESHL